MMRPSIRSAAVLMLASVLVIGACGSADKSISATESTTTSKAKAGSDETTTTTVDPQKFSDTLATLTTQIEDQRGDLCGLVGVLDGAGAAGNPTTADQAIAAATFLGMAYGAIADAAPAEASADAEVVRTAAESMVAETQQPGFDLEKFTSKGPAAFSDEKFLDSMSSLFAVVSKQCGGSPEG